MRSHSQPMSSRANMVIATEAMIVLPIWVLVRPRSSRTRAIMGAMPNHPKKARKKANQVRWKVRMCGFPRLKSLIRVALFDGGAKRYSVSLTSMTSVLLLTKRSTRPEQL